MKWLFLAMILPTFAFSTVKNIDYKVGDLTLKSKLVLPQKTDGKKVPVVVLFPDWMGNGDFLLERAKEIAKLGYAALAADVYGDGKLAKDVKEAAKLAGALKEGKREELRKRVKAGIDNAKLQKEVDATKVVAIGYCFGGTSVLEHARSGEALAGVVSFHGNLDTQSPGTKFNTKLLVLHGAIDPYVKKEDIDQFKDELTKAKADYQWIEYSGAVHSFTNPQAGNDISKGAAYNQLADKRSWEHFKDFLEEVF
ncbi:MAG: dienelactone hydrolase family protein [Candidatus Caldatribacteriota bacterium]